VSEKALLDNLDVDNVVKTQNFIK